MTLTLFHTCEAGQKSQLFAQWGVARLKQSLGSKSNGGNVGYISAIIFAPAIPHGTKNGDFRLILQAR